MVCKPLFIISIVVLFGAFYFLHKLFYVKVAYSMLFIFSDRQLRIPIKLILIQNISIIKEGRLKLKHNEIINKIAPIRLNTEKESFLGLTKFACCPK